MAHSEKPSDPPPLNDPPEAVYHQRIAVSFDYPVYFTRRVFDAGNPHLESAICRLNEQRPHRCLVLIDAGVAAAHPRLARQVKEYFHARPATLELAGGPEVVPGGEAAKNDWQAVRDVMWMVGNLHLDRHSFVVAVGGGAMLDMTGFAASLVHRGLRLVRLPTTTLAQGDAGIGVKTGMNEHGRKNFVGTFAPPFAVLNDFAFLSTLPDRDWIAGLAEAFKVAIIQDRDFFDFLCANAGILRGRLGRPAGQPGNERTLADELMEQLVRRCAVLHLDHIRQGGDPFELGSARPLDFGHWSAHCIETMSSYSVGHGQAVAIGVALDSYYAMRQRLLSEDELERILTGLTDGGLPVWCDCLDRRTPDGGLAILAGLEQFREHLGGVLSITLPDGLGHKLEVHQVNPLLVEEAAVYLRKRARRSHESQTESSRPPDVLP